VPSGPGSEAVSEPGPEGTPLGSDHRRVDCLLPDRPLAFVFLTLACLLVQAQTPPKAARDAFEKAAKAARNKKRDQAVSNYQKAVALDPDYAEAWCELGKLQLAQPPRPNSEWELLKLQSIGSFMTLASATGGEAFDAVGTKDVLPAILKSLAEHVRYDYVAGFYTSSSGGRKRHKVEVILRSKNRGEIVGGFRALVH